MAQLDLDFQRLPSQQHEVKIGWKVPSGSSETGSGNGSGNGEGRDLRNILQGKTDRLLNNSM